MDISKIEDLILKENYYLVICTGENVYYGYKVLRKQTLMLKYDFSTDYSTPVPFGPMVPFGTTSIPAGYNNYYVQIPQFPLIEISNVTDMFKITRTDEIYQIFMGIAPSYLRVAIRLNTTTLITTLEQSITPSISYLSEFKLDGFSSPFDEPAPESEMFAINPLILGLDLMNPVTIPILPILNFYVNRLIVGTIPKNLWVGILNNTIPARKVSAGTVDQVVSGLNATYLISGGA